MTGSQTRKNHNLPGGYRSLLKLPTRFIYFLSALVFLFLVASIIGYVLSATPVDRDHNRLKSLIISDPSRETTEEMQIEKHHPYGSSFQVSVRVNSPYIEVDPNKQVEFRTSQFVVLDGKTYPSRKVFYWSTKPVNGVLVLPLNPYAPHNVLQMVLDERKKYCEMHNYGLYARYIQDFAAEGKPAKESLGLAMLRMLRQAMLSFPNAEWFWLYDSRGHIQHLEEPLLPLREQEAIAATMDSDLYTDVVSITNFATDPKKAEIILAFNERTGMISVDSVFARNSIITHAALEFLVDPIFQEWEPFVSSEDHAGAAVTHLARWHPELVTKMAMVAPDIAGTRACLSTNAEDFGCIRTIESWSHSRPIAEA